MCYNYPMKVGIVGFNSPNRAKQNIYASKVLFRGNIAANLAKDVVVLQQKGFRSIAGHCGCCGRETIHPREF